MDSDELIEKAKELHGIEIDGDDINVKVLVRYALLVGYNEGYKEGSESNRHPLEWR